MSALKTLALALALTIFGTTQVQAATFVVNALADIAGSEDSAPGDGICEDVRGGTRCTLRAAIMEANALAGVHRIEFSVAGVIGVIGQPLPIIGKRLTIDGRTAPGYVNNGLVSTSPPVVTLDGGLLADPVDGLRIRTADADADADADASDVFALSIVNFKGNGISASLSAHQLWIQGCYIGIRPNGSAAGNGIGINLATNDNWIGRSVTGVAGLGNMVSSNTGNGIQILGTGNRIRGNRIGLGLSVDDLDRGNGGHGIHLIGSEHWVGEATNGMNANAISYNGGDGVRINGNNNHVYGNDIGFFGGNAGFGIYVLGDDNIIGTSSSINHVRRGANAIRIGSDAISADRNRVENNRIALGATAGVRIFNGEGNLILDNEIGANHLDGIWLQSGARQTSVAGNDIGFPRDGPGGSIGPALAPQGIGIYDEGQGSSIGIDTSGGGSAVRGNVIGFHTGVGIELGNTSQNARVQGNRIGLTQEGNRIGNRGGGVLLGTGTTGAVLLANVIGNNGSDGGMGGIRSHATGVRICGNLIGLDYVYENHGNANNGILLHHSSGALVGGATDCPGNFIGFNSGSGVHIEGQVNRVQGNHIGIAPNGTNIGNGRAGVDLSGAGAQDNDVLLNTIGFNAIAGIRLQENAGDGNLLRQNVFSGNGGGGVDLSGDGFTANDPGDADEGPNRHQNFPTISFIALTGSQLDVTYRVDTLAANAAFPMQVDFYLGDGSGTRQGQRFLASRGYATPLALETTSFMLPGGVFGGELLAMATDAQGNSSEFSPASLFGVVSPPGTIFSDGFESP